MGKTRKMMEFSKSVQLAIDIMMALWHGELNKLGLFQPRWKYFRFFGSILPGEIVEGVCFWEKASQWQRISRKIQFFGPLDDVLIAEVELVGNQSVPANDDGSRPTFWRVDRIRYNENYGMPPNHQANAKWHQFSFNDENKIPVY